MDNKISVIIPTLLKNILVLQQLITIMDADSSVSEIILINNTTKGSYLVGDKLKVYTPKENLYVNQSWNVGVSLIENEFFLIINDDILPPKNFCTQVLNTKILENENTGLVGLDNMYIQSFGTDIKELEVPTQNSNIYINPMNKILGTGNWGSAFFGKKSKWFDIPSDLKIIFGDNYILQKNIEAHKTNYKISGLKLNHMHSLTSSSGEFADIINKDIENSKKYFDTLKR